jgi:phosphoribosylformimino-5-aminoimidazole carboxamide ribotide isomerase
MDVIPAIDIIRGRVARLEKGEPSKIKFYDTWGSPSEVAKHWEGEGAKILHVVDLDAAMGTGSNKTQITKILREVSISVQVGGGLRSPKEIKDVLSLGAYRAIIGTTAIEEKEVLKGLLREVGNNRLVVALDYIGEHVVTRGWRRLTDIKINDAMLTLAEEGIKVFLLTSVSRDGLLTGPDFDVISNCVKNRKIEVIAAGGVGEIEDLKKLKKIGVDGVVVGRALYEGCFTLKDALKV